MKAGNNLCNAKLSRIKIGTKKRREGKEVGEKEGREDRMKRKKNMKWRKAQKEGRDAQRQGIVAPVCLYQFKGSQPLGHDLLAGVI